MGPLSNWLSNFTNSWYYMQQRSLWACGRKLGDRKKIARLLATFGVGFFLACRILMYLHCSVQIRRGRKETHRSPTMATDHRMRLILRDPLQISQGIPQEVPGRNRWHSWIKLTEAVVMTMHLIHVLWLDKSSWWISFRGILSRRQATELDSQGYGRRKEHTQ
jgi:hypothetical protein